MKSIQMNIEQNVITGSYISTVQLNKEC